MLTEYLSIVLVTLLGWLLWRWVHVRRHWAARGVPHAVPHPLLGSLTFLQRENTAVWMRKIYHKFKTPYVGIWLFWKPALVINDPVLAKRILVKDADTFRNRYLGSGKSDPIGALNIFTVDDPLWTNIRRRLTAVFTAAKLRNLEGLIVEKVHDLVERYKEEMGRNPEGINIRDINTDYTTDIIGEAAFGVRSQAARTGDSPIRKITRDFMEYSVFRGLSWSSIFFWPSLVDIFGFTLFPKDTTVFLEQLFHNIVEQRGGYDKPVSEPRDLLDALLKMRQDASKENEEIDKVVLVAQAAVFVQAGFDTSGTTLTWCFKEMAHAPHVQDKLYNELREAREKVGRDLDSKDLAELPYLNAVIKETLRKYPQMGWLDRVAMKDYKIDHKLSIPAGTPLYVNAVGMQSDARYFPDPEKFDPERFMPENEQKITPYTFMPFGEGPRMCIGMRFAYVSLRHALAAISSKFVLRAPPNAILPADCPLEHRGLFYIPDGPITLIFIRRN